MRRCVENVRKRLLIRLTKSIFWEWQSLGVSRHQGKIFPWADLSQLLMLAG
jgi:hypothetical protein